MPTYPVGTLQWAEARIWELQFACGCFMRESEIKQGYDIDDVDNQPCGCSYPRLDDQYCGCPTILEVDRWQTFLAYRNEIRDLQKQVDERSLPECSAPTEWSPAELEAAGQGGLF